ncbi:hypothetical protein D187_005681 [Cystobacter fuscus DSM 2262]|uniref:Transposase n=1 Tax=Cystobacter fuscus (strain ATCC 25194 / DSM 2262 / NBRC 100088 / M29) TaxID=1242864 RepID=S9PFW2_CYSF2|nr:hypothetical protein D187_005681 [Cystobacter fuscus DSM 2262]
MDFMCQQLGVSRSGDHAWKERPESERHKAVRALDERPNGTLAAPGQEA